ncbi:MAG: hypothetical protein ABSF80_13275, partial [Chitinispirillaceae bacterium]
AGSSLLYSVEMYTLIKQRLKEGGILQIWLPGGEKSLRAAVARSIAVSFPYVKVYRSIEDVGNHFLASMQPIPQLSAAELVGRMPARARQDLLTWCPNGDLEHYMQTMLSKEVPLSSLLSKDNGLMVTDAKPYNEYFLLRRMVPGEGNTLLMKKIAKTLRCPLKGW